MTRHLRILVAVAVLNGFSAIGHGSRVVDLYVLAGQSNMSGRVNSGYTHLPTVDNDVLYYYRTDGPPEANQDSGGGFVTLAPLATGYYGPEIALGRALHDVSVNKIAIVKVSDGGTSLAGDWNSRASSGNAWWQHWLSDTTDAVSDLVGLGYVPVLRGICWLQGECDAENSLMAANYETNFRNLVQDMHSHLGAMIDVSRAQFVTAGIVGPLPDGLPYAETVRLAQQTVMGEDPCWRYFSTRDLSTTDGLHYDPPSVATVGARFAEPLSSELCPSIVVSTSSGGRIQIDFRGVLYMSPDLSSWRQVDPQPSSPYLLSPLAERMNFVAGRD